MSTTSATRLILVRHGETLANREFRYIGVRNDLLSPHGEQQAGLVAQALASLAAVTPIAAVYSSPLQRAVRTAQVIVDQLSLPLQETQALIEGSFGEWEGLSRAEVLARSERDADLLQAWEQDPAIPPPGGESFAQIQQRIGTFVERLAQAYPGQTLVLVSHVGPIKVLLCQALSTSLSSMYNFFLDPATISVIDWKSRPLVRLLNSHAHLGWDQARWLHLLQP